MPEPILETPQWVNEVIDVTREIAAVGEIGVTAFVSAQGKIFMLDSSDIPADAPVLEAKELFAAVVRRAAVKLEADAVLLVSEAWTRVGDKEKETQETMDSPVSTHPDRKEAIVMTLETAKGSWMAMAILEGKMGFRVFGDLEFHSSDTRGRLTNLLPDKDGPVVTPS